MGKLSCDTQTSFFRSRESAILDIFKSCSNITKICEIWSFWHEKHQQLVFAGVNKQETGLVSRDFTVLLLETLARAGDLMGNLLRTLARKCCNKSGFDTLIIAVNNA